MSNWFSGDVIANGIKIHYYRTGGDKPPVVLSHGFSDNGMCWIRVAKALEEEYDLIMPDARGHGFSDAPETGYDGQGRAADVAGLIEALGLERPALIGHSMGASTTAMAAVQYPDLVGSAVLEDPPWFDENSPWARDRLNLSPEEQKAEAEKRRADIIANKSKTVEEIAAEGRKRSPVWDEIEFGPWAESKQQLSPNVIGLFGRQRAHWTEVVPKIACPTLLVIGDPEMHSIVTPAIAQQAEETNSLIEVVQLKGAGHNIRREQFEGFVKAVRTFLAAH
jgi:pimeloyl-ACP methyl ester carboxylesterase